MTNRGGPERWEPPGSGSDHDSNYHSDSAATPPSRAEVTMPVDTTEPMWVFVSIGLGLLALTGSVFALSMVGIAALITWLVRTRDGGGGQAPPHPFGGPRTSP